MRLSEAILLGRHLIANPAASDLSRCALGMALGATGYQVCGGDDGRGSDGEYALVTTRWDWLQTFNVECPLCGQRNYSYSSVTHMFDLHVITEGAWTLEQLCDWVRSIEPNEDAEPIQTHIRSSESAKFEESVK
jgi:hypothetical protein